MISLPISYRTPISLIPLAAVVFAAGCAAPGGGLSHLPRPALPDRPVVKAVEGPLNLDHAITRAVLYSERIAALRAAVDRAAEECHVVGDWRDPELRVQYGEESTDTERRLESSPAGGPLSTTREDSDSYRIGIRVFPPNPWARSARTTAAEARLHAARAEYHHARWQVAADVRRLFAQIRHAEKEQQLLVEAAGLHKEMRELTKQLLKKGQATLADDIAVSRKYLKSLSDRHRTAQEHLSKRRALASLVGLSVATLEIVHDSADLTRLEFLSGGTEGLELTALRHRSDLSAGLWRAAAANATYRESGSARIPWFTHVEGSLGGGGQTGERTGVTDSQGGEVTSDDATSDEWRISVGVNIPVSSWVGRTPEARLSACRQMEKRNRAAVERISAEIQSAVFTLRGIQERQRLYLSESAPVLEDMKTLLAKVEGESGLAPGERLRIREQILLSRRLKQETDFQYQLAAISLLEVVGTFPAAKKR